MDESAVRRIIPVILCGGAGTRLWPVSRRAWPKPLVALTGSETMVQATALRTADPADFEAPIVVTAPDYAQAVAAQLEEVGTPSQLVIVEPCARGTAAAIALAALNVPPDALLLILPSDHVITDAGAFRSAIAAAESAAASGWLVTFGVTPDRPETGYGYIRQSQEIDERVFKVACFAEKPAFETAEAYLAEGGWSWNAGIFLMRASALLAALGEHAPEILAATNSAVAGQRREGRWAFPDGELLADASGRSVDHAVMEVSSHVAVVPVEMGWSDVGSWEAVHAIGTSDDDGNVLAGDVIALGAKNCLVRSDGPVVVAIGVEDLVIVATERSVLVVPRSQSQRVKEAVEAIEARKGRNE